MIKVAIVDYGMGNIDSVVKAVEINGATALIATTSQDLELATHIIIPGVGSYDVGMKNMIKLGIIKSLKDQILNHKKPLLGICLGMQILSQKGYEGKETDGLGLIEGEVKLFQSINKNERIPHIGWNEVSYIQESPIFKDIPNKKDFYFVHSYHFDCANKNNILATTPYCGEFVSAVIKQNIIGVQFHPEKSQKYGIKIIENFLNL